MLERLDAPASQPLTGKPFCTLLLTIVVSACHQDHLRAGSLEAPDL